MALFLTEAEVESLIEVEEVMKVVEDGLRAHGEGKAHNRPRQRAVLDKVVLQTMNAAVGPIGRLGLKAYTTGPHGARFWVMLFDETGTLLALLQADKLGQVRTGCTSGVAAKYMSRPDSRVLGLIGTGWQARTQLEAILLARPIEEVRVYSRRPENVQTFCREMSERLPRVQFIATDSAEAAVTGADVVATITNAVEPVVLGRWLKPGSTVLAAGSNRAHAREVDTETIVRCRLIIADSVEQAQMESGDLIIPAREGALSWENVHELGDVVAGKIPGRTKPDEINLFTSLGLALEDVVTAELIYTKAKARGIGVELPIG